ncbi:hypothetical protein PHET_01329 [Paragonimus heterotremus]|uniref:Uncharacterized protein n=1 Tax=Paragonimus heterotremus TaxID=100268 RepID=A0A8J4T5Q0_9TREM|nr:hypothetical protein PHET_01329 [Paragonimus heterotremus]
MKFCIIFCCITIIFIVHEIHANPVGTEKIEERWSKVVYRAYEFWKWLLTKYDNDTNKAWKMFAEESSVGVELLELFEKYVPRLDSWQEKWTEKEEMKTTVTPSM